MNYVNSAYENFDQLWEAKKVLNNGGRGGVKKFLNPKFCPKKPLFGPLFRRKFTFYVHNNKRAFGGEGVND